MFCKIKYNNTICKTKEKLLTDHNWHNCTPKNISTAKSTHFTVETADYTGRCSQILTVGKQ